MGRGCAPLGGGRRRRRRPRQIPPRSSWKGDGDGAGGRERIPRPRGESSPEHYRHGSGGRRRRRHGRPPVEGEETKRGGWGLLVWRVVVVEVVVVVVEVVVVWTMGGVRVEEGGKSHASGLGIVPRPSRRCRASGERRRWGRGFRRPICPTGAGGGVGGVGRGGEGWGEGRVG